MKKMYYLTLFALISGCTTPAQEQGSTNILGPSQNGTNNQYIAAVAWKQTAAEYRALYYQGYSLAKKQVQKAIANRKAGDRPLAVVTDLDDTVLLPLRYWGTLVKQRKDFFDDNVWDEWIPENQMVLAPGAADFFKFCQENQVEVFYVTSRNQGENTYDYAMQHIKQAKLPNTDTEHLTVLRETSNKQKPQSKIADTHDIIVFLGDNLNDFSRKFYTKDVDERLARMEEEKDQYGNRYIVFPNPTDGHWIKAIFGDSEPPANDKNREIFMKAASRLSWDK